MNAVIFIQRSNRILHHPHRSILTVGLEPTYIPVNRALCPLSYIELLLWGFSTLNYIENLNSNIDAMFNRYLLSCHVVKELFVLHWFPIPRTSMESASRSFPVDLTHNLQMCLQIWWDDSILSRIICKLFLFHVVSISPDLLRVVLRRLEVDGVLLQIRDHSHLESEPFLTSRSSDTRNCDLWYKC